jgi:hypothetical protein
MSVTQGKHFPGFLVLCFLMLAAGASHAASQETEAYFTGPLLTSNAVTLPASNWLIEPYLMYYDSNALYDHRRMRHRQAPALRQWQTSVPIYYGVTDRLQLQLSAGGAHATSGGMHTNGIGATDTTVGVQYMLLSPDNRRERPAVSIGYSHRFPTGAYDRLDQNPLDTMGNGANVDTFTALLQQYVTLPNDRPMRFRATVSYSLPPDRVDITGMSAYDTPPDFRGQVKLGSSLGISTAVEYSIDTRWALAMDLTYSRDAASRLHGIVRSHGTSVPFARRDALRDIYTLAPAVEDNFNDRIGIVTGAQVSFAGRNSRAFVMPMTAINMMF